VLAGSLLEVACREMGLALTREQLQEGCSAALRTIHEGELPSATLGSELSRMRWFVAAVWAIRQIVLACSSACLHNPPPPTFPPLPCTAPPSSAVVDHDRQLVAGTDSWLPPLEECGEEEREGLHRMMKARTACVYCSNEHFVPQNQQRYPVVSPAMLHMLYCSPLSVLPAAQ
jgi:hypothetical protein